MEALQAIFTQLGLDSSIFYQFLIVAVVFTVSQFIFLNKLQFVIEHRENKTHKLEKKAEKKLAAALELSEKYQTIIENAFQKAQKQIAEKKQEVMVKEEEAFKRSEEEVAKSVEQARQLFFKEIEQKKKEVFSNTEALAQLLVNKISK